MRSSVLTILIIFIGFSYVAAVTEKDCSDAFGKVTKRVSAKISSCTKQFKFKNMKEKTAKANCVYKCVLISEGFLNKDALIDADSVKLTIETIKQMTFLPEDMKTQVIDFTMKCKDTTTSGFDPSPADEFCKSYEPFFKCIMAGIQQMCGIAGRR